MDPSPPMCAPLSSETADDNVNENLVVVKGSTQSAIGNTASTKDEVDPDLLCEYFGYTPKLFQRFRSIRIVMFWFTWVSFFQISSVLGLMNVAMTSLERRYGLTTTEAAFNGVLYEVGICLFALPISYYGNNFRKTRIMAMGALFMSIGLFIMTMPHFTVGYYEYQAPVSPVCSANTSSLYTGLCNAWKTNLNSYKYIFWFGALTFGLGATPTFIIAPAYLEENCDISTCALYIGILYAMSGCGAAVGTLVNGNFLDIFVDVGRPHPGLTKNDRHLWVGAWWIGFIINGFLLLFAVFPLYGFPKRIAQCGLTQSATTTENADSEPGVNNIHVLFRKLMLLLKNGPYVCITIVATCEMALITALGLYGPKYIETTFKIAASLAATLFGGVVVVMCALGMICGGLIMKCFNLSIRRTIQYSTVISVLSVPLCFCFMMSCGSETRHGFAGMTATYQGKPLSPQSINFTSSCNIGCQCLADKYFFEPSCGGKGLTYFSPCFAGCKSITKGREYYDCECVSANPTLSVNASKVSQEACPVNCPNTGIVLALVALTVFAISSIGSPVTMITICTVPQKQKSFALGVQAFIMRILGGMVAPTILGKLIDHSCSMWHTKCGVQENCLSYHEVTFNSLLTAFAGLFKLFSATAMFLTLWTFKEEKVEATCENEK